MNNSFIEISSDGGRIGKIAWCNRNKYRDIFGFVWWSCWPWSFEIERTIVDAQPKELKANYYLVIEND